MSSKRILLVEDDKLVRELYEEVLRDAGFGVESAVDGEEGLAKIRQGGWDLILLDMMLPKIDGLGVLRDLKNDPPKIKSGPIILVTNLDHDPVIKLAVDLGVFESIIKSDITPGDLVNKVKKILQSEL